mgnify:CR=1 FL=1
MVFSDSFLPPGLTYRHGVVGAGKTAGLLAFYYELRAAAPDGSVILTKPSIDTRHGGLIASRNGRSAAPSFLLGTGPEYATAATFYSKLRGACASAVAVLVDEAQFLLPIHVEALRELTHDSIPVVCYGLRTDFQGRAFPGSLRLFELADRVEQIHAACKCGSLAAFNAHVAGDAAPKLQVQIGGDELFRGACHACWNRSGAPLA